MRTSKIKIYNLIITLFFVIPHSFCQLNEFMIQSYFYGAKPTNIGLENFFKELKDEYGFNSIFVITRPSYNFEEGCKAVKNAGLNAVLLTTNLRAKNPVFNPDMALQELNKYSDSDYNVIGYQVMDEPNAKTSFSPHGFNKNEDGPICEYIDNLPQYTNFIKDFESSLLRYANLFPISVFPGDRYKEYREEYLQKYINDSHPNILSFDHYPIYHSNDSVYDFFMSLYAFALKSSENGIPFIYVLTPYRKTDDYHNEPTNTLFAKGINEFNYVIYAALAYGAKGLSYWPGFEWVVNQHKNLKLEYNKNDLEKLVTLHKKLKSSSDELLSLNFISAYHESNSSTIGNPPEEVYDFCLWTNFLEDPYAQKIFRDTKIPLYEPYSTQPIPNELVITFLVNKTGQIYFWLFNKSLERKLSLMLNLRNQVRDVLNKCDAGNNITLEPGEGKLYTPDTTTCLVSANIDNITYNNQLYPLTINDQLIIGSTSNFILNSVATKSFCANSINIKSMHAKEGSLARFISYKDSNTIPNGRPVKSNKDNASIIEEKQYSDKTYYIYPNPVNDIINLHIDLEEGEEIDVILHDITGRIIKRFKTTMKETYISAETIQPGVFFISFTREKQLYNIKVIKK